MARHSDPNAVEGSSPVYGDVLLKSAVKLKKLVKPGVYGVTSPTFINGSKKFALTVLPVGDVPGDIIQIQHPLDVGFPNTYSCTCISGVWSAWSSQADNIESLALPVAEGAIEDRLEQFTMLRNIDKKVMTEYAEVSMLPATLLGSPTIPANSLTKLGTKLVGYADGVISTGTATTGKLAIQVGATKIEGTDLTLPNNLTRMALRMEFTLTLVTATTLRLTLTSTIQTAQGQATPIFRSLVPETDITFDPAADTALDLLYTLGGGAGATHELREIVITKL